MPKKLIYPYRLALSNRHGCEEAWVNLFVKKCTVVNLQRNVCLHRQTPIRMTCFANGGSL
jgi:hypothetical protein